MSRQKFLGVLAAKVAQDEQRARLLGVMDKGRGYAKLILPLCRQSFGYWIGDAFFPHYRPTPLRRNIDYQAVGRKTFLVNTPVPGLDD